jgi:HSP20 family protein
MLINVFNDLYRINREMNRMLYGRDEKVASYWPEVNIYENENSFMVLASVPGMDKEKISISLKDNSLKISGAKETAVKDEINYHLRERKHGDFERNFLLDEKVDVNNISAEMKNGQLLIKIPKSPETKPVKIDIK